MNSIKYCVVCGSENFSRSPKFCCKKCQQKYYYLKNKQKLKNYKKIYYENNKSNYLSRDKDKYNEYMKSYMSLKRLEKKRCKSIGNS